MSNKQKQKKHSDSLLEKNGDRRRNPLLLYASAVCLIIACLYAYLSIDTSTINPEDLNKSAIVMVLTKNGTQPLYSKHHEKTSNGTDKLGNSLSVGTVNSK